MSKYGKTILISQLFNRNKEKVVKMTIDEFLEKGLQYVLDSVEPVILDGQQGIECKNYLVEIDKVQLVVNMFYYDNNEQDETQVRYLNYFAYIPKVGIFRGDAIYNGVADFYFGEIPSKFKVKPAGDYLLYVTSPFTYSSTHSDLVQEDKSYVENIAEILKNQKKPTTITGEVVKFISYLEDCAINGRY